MEEEEVAADTTSSLSQYKGKSVTKKKKKLEWRGFKLHCIQDYVLCLCLRFFLCEEDNDFLKLVIMALIRRLPAHILVTR